MARFNQMISIPNKIKIGAWDVKIQLQDNLSDKSGDDRYAVTLVWHEICHAIHSQYQIDSESGEEKTVGAYSQGIVQVSGDNPQLTKWMTQCLK